METDPSRQPAGQQPLSPLSPLSSFLPLLYFLSLPHFLFFFLRPPHPHSPSLTSFSPPQEEASSSFSVPRGNGKKRKGEKIEERKGEGEGGRPLAGRQDPTTLGTMRVGSGGGREGKGGRWPGSACRARAEGCCLPTTGEPELDFFVMGLYPADSSGKILTKCNDTKFLVNALANFIGDMYSYMPNLKCPSNNGVSSWKRLWSLYGVCSGLNETEYFRRSLLLISTINLLPRLKRLGFGPRDDKKYNTGLLQAAINDAVGNTTRVACNTKVEGGRQLSQIWMCVDKDVSELIKCPVYPTSTCPDEIFFETFTADMMHSTEPSFNPIEMPISISDDE